MAEEQNVETTIDPEEDFDKWLANSLAATEDDPEEEEAEDAALSSRDRAALKEAQKTKKMVAKHIMEERVEKRTNAFLADASELEKEAFAVFVTGEEDEKQIEKIIDMVKSKVGALNATKDEAAHKEADQIARDSYGAGVIPPGEKVNPEDEVRKDLWGRVQATGDERALLALLAEDNDFLQKALYEKR